jgi:hypothetical protein
MHPSGRLLQTDGRASDFTRLRDHRPRKHELEWKRLMGCSTLFIAAKRRKIAAHGVSRGCSQMKWVSPERGGIKAQEGNLKKE